MHKRIAAGLVVSGLAVGGLVVAVVAPVDVAGAGSAMTELTVTDGRPEGHGRRLVVGIVTTSAEALGVPAKELVVDLRAGRSIAEVAEAEGVDLAVVTEALAAKAGAAVDAAVAAGRIDEEQAARIAARLPEAIDRLVHFHKGDRRP